MLAVPLDEALDSRLPVDDHLRREVRSEFVALWS
jgi:hypothetical protein